MASYKGSIDLLQFDRAGVITIKGVKCVIIPIEANDFGVYTRSEQGKKDSVYLNFCAWENKNGASEYGTSHGIKQDFSKAFAESHQEEIKSLPFVGNLTPITPKSNSERIESMPTSPEYSPQDIENPDELPF